MFDKEKISDILKSIIQHFDSLRDFSSECNVNRTTISKLVRKELNKPPKPDILKKIADNSKGVTTYDELMAVCGYINESQKLDKIKSDLLIKKQKIMDKVKSLKLNDDDEAFLSYIIDKKEEISKIHIDMIKNDKLLLAREYLHEEYSNLYDEISKTKSKNIKKAIDLYDEMDIINHDLELCEKENLSNKNYDTFDKYEKTIKIPVVGTVAAGEPILAEQNIIDYEELPAKDFIDGEYFGLKIKGDSMFPRILDGDVVIIRQQNDCDNGQVAVVLVNGCEATVKQVKKTDSGIMLIPFNTTKYEPLFFTKDDIIKMPVKIIGIVKRLIGYNFG